MFKGLVQLWKKNHLRSSAFASEAPKHTHVVCLGVGLSYQNIKSTSKQWLFWLCHDNFKEL